MKQVTPRKIAHWLYASANCQPLSSFLLTHRPTKDDNLVYHYYCSNKKWDSWQNCQFLLFTFVIPIRMAPVMKMWKYQENGIETVQMGENWTQRKIAEHQAEDIEKWTASGRWLLEAGGRFFFFYSGSLFGCLNGGKPSQTVLSRSSTARLGLAFGSVGLNP